jgi:hypothetical protein
LRGIVSRLHPQQVVDIRAERLVNPQRHLRGQRRLAIDQVGQRRPPHAKHLGRFGDGKA